MYRKTLMLLFFKLIFFESFGQIEINLLGAARTATFFPIEQLGNMQSKLGYSIGGTIGSSSLIKYREFIFNLNTGLFLENTRVDLANNYDYNFNVKSLSVPFYLSIHKKEFVKIGVGFYACINSTSQLNEKLDSRRSVEDQFFNLFDWGLNLSTRYMIPNSIFNIFGNYQLSVKTQMEGYRAVNPFGVLSPPFPGTRMHAFNLGIGVLILK